ncbi:MAG: hypothetical protein ACLPTZ_07200 [Beijerinckiaceae bacterium]
MNKIDEDWVTRVESTRRTASLPPGIVYAAVACFGEETRCDYTFDAGGACGVLARMIIRHSMFDARGAREAWARMMNTNKEIRGRD